MSFGKSISIYFIIGLLLISTNTVAQTNTAVADSIDKQFEEMIESSNNFKERNVRYKVIKLFKIRDLRAETQKQVNRLSEEIGTLNEKNEQQAQELVQIEDKLETSNANLEKAEKSKDEFTWLGMQVQKGFYQNVVYGIIILLVVVLLFLIVRYRNNKAVTIDSKKKLEEMEADFDDYRKKALETQQKLGRQLQDERLKGGKSDSAN